MPLKTIKITDTENFRIRTHVIKGQTCVSISNIQENGNPRFLGILFNVGPNTTSDFMDQYIGALRCMKSANEIISNKREGNK